LFTLLLILGRVNEWVGVGLAIHRWWVWCLMRHCCLTTLGKLFTLCASVIKQYYLVLANGQWCPVTVGLAEEST